MSFSHVVKWEFFFYPVFSCWVCASVSNVRDMKSKVVWVLDRPEYLLVVCKWITKLDREFVTSPMWGCECISVALVLLRHAEHSRITIVTAVNVISFTSEN